ncbi:MAG: hypothetical protein NE327_13390 [Lentisphaeraceae bacterium]|nr:hypothetical protein [Lentisphaeraceae bacterium]
MNKEEEEELELLRDALYIQSIGNEAVQQAIARNKEKKIPSVFSRDGIIYYLMPSGEITTKSPFQKP